jgi:hypothetical protein
VITLHTAAQLEADGYWSIYVDFTGGMSAYFSAHDSTEIKGLPMDTLSEGRDSYFRRFNRAIGILSGLSPNSLPDARVPTEDEDLQCAFRRAVVVSRRRESVRIVCRAQACTKTSTPDKRLAGQPNFSLGRKDS